MSVASICNILTPELISGVGEYVASCQTYEGGISSRIGTEAHGGYAFCGIATLKILNKMNLLNEKNLLVNFLSFFSSSFFFLKIKEKLHLFFFKMNLVLGRTSSNET